MAIRPCCNNGAEAKRVTHHTTCVLRKFFMYCELNRIITGVYSELTVLEKRGRIYINNSESI